MKKRGPCPTPKNSVNAKNYIFERLITAIGDIKNLIQVNRSPSVLILDLIPFSCSIPVLEIQRFLGHHICLS